MGKARRMDVTCIGVVVVSRTFSDMLGVMVTLTDGVLPVSLAGRAGKLRKRISVVDIKSICAIVNQENLTVHKRVKGVQVHCKLFLVPSFSMKT